MNCGLLQMLSALIAIKSSAALVSFFALVHCVHLCLSDFDFLGFAKHEYLKLCKLNSFQTCSYLENDASERCEIVQ